MQEEAVSSVFSPRNPERSSANTMNNTLQEHDLRDSSRINTQQVRFDEIQTFMQPYRLKEPIDSFFARFDEIRDLFQLTEIQALAYCRRLLTGEVVTFLNSVPLAKSYDELKKIVIKEFKTSINVADLHKQLMNEKKQREENYMTYYYRVKEIAATGHLDEETTKHYLVHGSGVKEEIAVQMQTSKTTEELKDIFRILDRERSTPQAHFSVPRRTFQQRPRPPFQPRGPGWQPPRPPVPGTNPWRCQQQNWRPAYQRFRQPFYRARWSPPQQAESRTPGQPMTNNGNLNHHVPPQRHPHE